MASRRTPLRSWACAALLVGATLLAAGCGMPTRQADKPPAPPPTYRGPEFLRGTIGSLATLRGYQPTFVSGFGLVVGLDGTGSADAPPGLRKWLIDEMAKRGFGRHQTGYEDLSPEQVLASEQTAVVRVEGVIPRGAPKGTRFDLRVEALPQTQTTSLVGGQLYTTELRIGGADFGRPSGKLLARGGGPLFIDPIGEDSTEEDQQFGEQRVGRVLAGGITQEPMDMQLALNRPSYRRTQQIADRINGRFPPSPNEDRELATAKSDSVVALHVIDRFRDDPQHMLDLISHLYLNPSVDFARQKAKELAKLLDDPVHDQHARAIAYAWMGLGTRIQPILRELYTHDRVPPRLAALEAGSRLKDLKTSRPLFEIARGDYVEGQRIRATRMLGVLLSHHPQHAQTVKMLRELLDARNIGVRFAAYGGLAAVRDRRIQRFAFGNKMELAQIRCDRPLIYATRRGAPRVLVFNDRAGFNHPLLFTSDDGQFMLRSKDRSGRAANEQIDNETGGQSNGERRISVFYQRPGRAEPIETTIPARVGYLIGTMAFQPDPETDSRSVGLDMSYSRIVRLLHQMDQAGVIEPKLVLQETNLSGRIDRRRRQQTSEPRPETSDSAETGSTTPGSVAPGVDSQENRGP